MNIELITINDQPGLAARVAQRLGQQLHKAKLKRFADGEMRVALEDQTFWSDRHAVIMQSTGSPVHDHIMQLAFLAYELKNAEAEKVTAIIPYFGYARQEKSDIADKPGPAAVVVRLLEAAGVDVVITVAVHTPVIEEFFTVPFHNISLVKTIAQQIKQQFESVSDICLVAPDQGAHERVKALAQELDVEQMAFYKERYAADKTRVIKVVGSCTVETAIIVDDIIDTGGTALNACDELRKCGIKNIYGYFVHPVFSGDALQKVGQSALKKIFVSNTLALSIAQSHTKVEVFDVSVDVVNAIEQLILKV